MKKGILISVIALLIASVGVLIAVAAFFKKQQRELRDDLDYDCFDFDDDFDDDGEDDDTVAELGDAIADSSGNDPWA